jgi:hypothetical protein
MGGNAVITTGAVADDQKAGMMLDELAAFVQEAMRAGIPGDTIVKARVTMRGTIKSLETKP